jgi:hypothetical protein
MSMQEANRAEPDTRPGWYYVTIRDGPRHGLLAGPFEDDHPAALALVDQIRAVAQTVNTRAGFAAFGTAWSEIDQGPGILHDGHGWTPRIRGMAPGNPKLAELLARYDDEQEVLA